MRALEASSSALRRVVCSPILVWRRR
jgi:hypothetical protein